MSRTSWNRLADKFETDVCDITRTETSNQLSRCVDQVAPSRERSVLVDLGCGIGTFIRAFGDRFGEIVAVDIAPRMVARAKQRCNGRLPKTTWLAMGIEGAAKRIGTRADLTVCLNVITSPQRARQNGLWASVAAVTKPRGYALVVVPSIESARMVRAVETRGRKRVKPAAADGVVRRANVWVKHYAREELRALLPRYGLIVRRIGRGYFPWTQEGLTKPRSIDTNPWDWVCLAQRVEAA
ncbi:MAG TPA: class I SAM-dependent methyltransferase [Xanthobacteraceae bacterium]|nr:class I SAM-dependent methyltransferase [Xanthobacteraceae bacterium]